MKNSVSYEIVKFLEQFGEKYTPGGIIEDYIRQIMGAKASNASRRCRELVNEKKIEVVRTQINGKGPKVVHYRIKPQRIVLPQYRVEKVGQLSLI